MNPAVQFLHLTRLHLQMNRTDLGMVIIIQLAFSIGFVLGFGYLIPDIQKNTAAFITIGTATQNLVIIGCVMLPQMLAQGKREGRLEYFLALPISREAYLLANVAMAAIYAIPGAAFAVLLGAWRYDLDLQVSIVVLAVVPLAIFSLAGVGIAMAVFMRSPEAVNATTQLVIFYVIFFAPVMIPREQLPDILQATARFLPPTYAADAMRATLTDLPGTHLGRSLAALTGFAVLSVAGASLSIRRRG